MCAHTVRLEPVGVEFEVEPGETVLNAAFRQGIALPHGCKEGQCSACKCILTDGEVDMLRYSTFALNDSEKESGHILLCRARAYSDIEVELLNYDEELLSHADRGQDVQGSRSPASRGSPTTSAASRSSSRPRSSSGRASMSTSPSRPKPGRRLRARSPWQIRRSKPKSSSSSSRNTPKENSPASSIPEESQSAPPSASSDPTAPASDAKNRDGPMILVGAGSGMSPIWSILHDHLTSGETAAGLFLLRRAHPAPTCSISTRSRR